MFDGLRWLTDEKAETSPRDCQLFLLQRLCVFRLFASVTQLPQVIQHVRRNLFCISRDLNKREKRYLSQLAKARGRHALLTTLRFARSKVAFRTSSISSFHFAASLLNFIPGSQLGRCRTKSEDVSVCAALEKSEEKMATHKLGQNQRDNPRWPL